MALVWVTPVSGCCDASANGAFFAATLEKFSFVIIDTTDYEKVQT